MATRRSRRNENASSGPLTVQSTADTAGRKHVEQIYFDSNGDSWRRTYIRVDSTDLTILRAQHDAGKIELVELPLPPEDFRTVEMRWLSENGDSLEKLYPGEWIAIDGPELVAHSGSLADLLQLATDAGHPDPFITAIPATPIIHFAL